MKPTKIAHKIPEGTQAGIQGSYYKIGFMGKVYRHNGDDWVTSARDKAQVVKQIKLQKHEITPQCVSPEPLIFPRNTEKMYQQFKKRLMRELRVDRDQIRLEDK